MSAYKCHRFSPDVIGYAVYLQAHRDGAVEKRFFDGLLRSQGGEPRNIVTDKPRSYGVAHQGIIPESIHVTEQYANNRIEQSFELTWVRAVAGASAAT